MIETWLQNGQDVVRRDATRAKPKLHNCLTQSEHAESRDLMNLVRSGHTAQLGYYHISRTILDKKEKRLYRLGLD
jgi:hypothetical protein